MTKSTYKYLDSSVIIAALSPGDPASRACARLLGQAGNITTLHALQETFNTLTGGRQEIRVGADEAARLIREKVVPAIKYIPLNMDDILETQTTARARGVRGGAIYDFQHLHAARRAGTESLYTLDSGDFACLCRPGDPAIIHP